MSKQQKRYTLHPYSPAHWAIDCETCNCKIANLTPDKPSSEIIGRILAHEKTYHE